MVFNTPGFTLLYPFVSQPYAMNITINLLEFWTPLIRLYSYRYLWTKQHST